MNVWWKYTNWIKHRLFYHLSDASLMSILILTLTCHFKLWFNVLNKLPVGSFSSCAWFVRIVIGVGSVSIRSEFSSLERLRLPSGHAISAIMSTAAQVIARILQFVLLIQAKIIIDAFLFVMPMFFFVWINKCFIFNIYKFIKTIVDFENGWSAFISF